VRLLEFKRANTREKKRWRALLNQAAEHEQFRKVSSSIIGTWSGTIDLDGTPVPVVLHIDSPDSGDSALSITADFPQHRRSSVPFGDVSFEQGVLRFATNNMGSYVGGMSGDGGQIVGALSKKDKNYPLTLNSGDLAFVAPVRPQTPQPSFSYAVEQVHVDNVAAQCRLAGTLTIPHDRQLRAVVLLITGSGAMDRDETVFGHKPFWVLADYLSRRGYAVLRLDDRGVAESSGDRSAITPADEADDMAAAVEFLRSRQGLQGLPVGLIGHSMGGVIAAQLAARRPEIAFVVSMAGPAMTLGEAMTERECQALEKSGARDEAISRHGQFARALFAELRERPDSEPIDAAWISALASRIGASGTAAAASSDVWIKQFNLPWMRHAFRLEPVNALRRIRMPVLAINGSVDVQTVAKSNLALMSEVLKASGHADFQVIELPGLNHLFQTCSTGDVYKYPAIEETFAPLALDTIGTWLDARFPRRRQ
jgi:uncharacterized protein